MLEQVRKKMAACIQCGTCSGSCPNLFAMDYTPRQVWRLVMIGDAESIFQSRTFYLCSSCYTCTLRCPRGLPVTEAMDGLKQAAAQQGAGPARSGRFYQSFLKSVERHGRINEMEFMTLYLWALKSPLVAGSFLPLGWKLMRRRKIAVDLPVRRGNRFTKLFQTVQQVEADK